MEEIIQLILDSSYIIKNKFGVYVRHHLENTSSKKYMRKIIDLPLDAAAKLSNTYKHKLDEEQGLIQKIHAIGLIGWTIWTAIDTIQDSEHEKENSYIPNDPLALFLILRPIVDEMLNSIYLSKNDKKKLVRKISMMEYVNSTWCTLHIKDRFINKSVGVSVPLLLLLLSVGAETKYIKLCQKYFHHFIGARQLSDDALDWPEDMKKKQPTLVTQWLEEAIGADKSLHEYRKVFDTTISPRVARKILKHSHLSIRYAKQMTCFTSTEFLEELPKFYEVMTTHILQNFVLKDVCGSNLGKSKSAENISA